MKLTVTTIGMKGKRRTTDQTSKPAIFSFFRTASETHWNRMRILSEFASSISSPERRIIMSALLPKALPLSSYRGTLLGPYLTQQRSRPMRRPEYPDS